MTWKPHADPRVVGDSSIQYLRSAHGHEGAHDVTVGGVTLRVLPDVGTTGRKRSDTILAAVTQAHAVTHRSVANPEMRDVEIEAGSKTLDDFDPLAYVVGYLITAGIRNLEIEGEPIHPQPGPSGEWRVELRDDGSLHAAFLGGAQ